VRSAEEVVAAHFAPTWRGMLARALADRGLPQTEIATLLGVTQSAVSKHLGGRLGMDASLEAEPRMRATVERVAQGLASKRLSSFEALHEMEALVRAFEDRGPICALHEEEEPGLRGLGCDVCVRVGVSPLLAEQAALQDLRAGLRVLEAIDGLALVVPHVGANLARALPGARDVTQVAAVPGRLIEVKGAVRAPAPPEFGVSQHVAEVLLAVLRADGSKLACLNLAPQEALLDAARAAGWRVERVGAEVERAPSSLTFDEDRVPDVFHHGGAFGVEPQAYFVAEDAVSLATRVRRLVDRLR
jgi:predicted fused transcriptional regulator/phosphomethylpyrimidine kinase/predicted transcriptional regulator